MIKWLAVSAILFSACSSVSAEVFKCTGTDGRVSFGPAPCHPTQGTAEYQRGALPADDPYSARALHRNQQAVRIMQMGNKPGTVVTIVPDSSRPAARKRSANRPRPIVTNCYQAGSIITTCRDSNGGMSNTITNGNISTGTYFPGNR